jgi:hypothetical protein
VGKGKEKYAATMNKKMGTTIEYLCRGIPREFGDFLRYARSLGFDEEPDYASLRASFRSLSVRLGFTYDYDFDWTILNVYRTIREALLM